MRGGAKTGCRARAALAAFAAVAAFTLGGAFAGAASAATLTVNDDLAGPGPSGSTCSTPDFATVGAALAAAAGGDTINVCAGSYEEAVSVTTDGVTIRGAAAGVDARDRDGAAESVLSPPDSASIGVDVDADDFTLDGMTIADTTATGLRLAGGAGHTLVNDVFRGASSGVFLVGDDGGADTIRHNFFDGNAVNGMQTSSVYAAELTVDENSFRGHPSTAIGLQRADAGAEITGNATDGDSTFLVLQRVTGGVVADNDVHGATGTAIFLANGNDGVVIRGNSIEGLDGGPSSSSGIRLSSAFGAAPANEDVDILGNEITGRTPGIRIEDGMHAGTLDVHFNRIAGNVTGILDDDDDPGHEVDAAGNWWGCNEGPGTADCDAVDGIASDRVAADPRLVLELAVPSSLLTDESSPVFATLTRDSAGGEPSPNELPPAAIAFAATGGAVTPSATTSGGVATASFTAGPDAGTATVEATLDGETASGSIAIAARPGGPQGTPGDDRLFGGGAADRIFGAGGDDFIAGAGGDDVLDGGPGDDEIRGGHGNDKLIGGPGRDELRGGRGADVLDARDGRRDIVRCGRGRDRVKADRIDRVLRGCKGFRGRSRS